MADKKISQLTSLAPALNTDELPINRSNASGKLTVADILSPEATIRAAKDGDLTTLNTTDKSNLVSAINEVNTGLASKVPSSYLDTDTTLAANSDSKIATQKATKAYVLANVTPSATETVQGKAEIATQAETNTGTDDTRFVTPLKLKTNLDSKGYLTGTGTANAFPRYTAGTTLGTSAIAQSAAGNRILVNGVTDDLGTALQVSGSIRQTAITSVLGAVDSNGKIVSGGSGTSGRIPVFYGSTSFLANSLIRDDSSTVSIGVATDAGSKLYVPTSDTTTSIRSSNSSLFPATTYSLVGNTSGTKAGSNIGVYGIASGSTISNIAMYGDSSGATSPLNIGGWFSATGGTTNYSLQLTDGTQATGKFLKSITSDGKANWANITTADITSGFAGAALNNVPRYGTLTTFSPSTIYDNGSNTGIGNAPLSNSKLFVATSSVNIYTINASNSTATGITYALIGNTSGAKSSQNVGAAGYALNSTTENTGVLGSAVIATTGKNVGGSFLAALGATNYAVQLKDGTEAAGKVLQCMDSNGYANWGFDYNGQTILVNTTFTNEPISINFNLGNYVVLDYSSTIATATSVNAVSFSNMKQGRIYKIKVKQGPSPAGETYTPTFAGMKWPGGTAFTPTTGTGKIDFIEVYYDGVAYYGDFIKNYV